MNISCKQKMTLTEAKLVLKEFKSGTIKRFDSDAATLKDYRGRTYTLFFRSNLELKNLIRGV